MTDPRKGKEEAKRRQIESKPTPLSRVIEEFTEEGKALNIRVERDENGEQRITTDTESAALTTERIREIQDMAPETARIQLTSARDKLIWFRHQVD